MNIVKNRHLTACVALAGIALTGCAVGQPAGYTEGVRDAQMMVEFGDPEILVQMDNELNYQGFCEGTWANFGSDVPVENRPGYIEGCKDTIRAAAEALR